MTEADSKVIQTLYVINKLSIKAAASKSRESLTFMIVNDTIALGRYDRALLWDIEGKSPELLGVSGQAKFPKTAKIVQKWHEELKHFEDLNKPQMRVLAHNQEERPGPPTSTIIWLPIMEADKPILGLWLELWRKPEQDELSPKGMVKLLSELLLPAYGVAWKRLHRRFSFKKLPLSRQALYYACVTLLVCLFAIRLPLRVVAPLEVVPKDPVVITAPLEGIIEKVVVEPGEFVEKETPLFEYDKQVPLQQLKVAEKNVQILQSELNRATSLGVEDDKHRSEYAILIRKLEKERANLDFAEYQAGQLTVKAPEAGYAMIENPDEWRGNPVQVGERVLAINHPEQTKLRMWIPEADNIPFDSEKPVKVFLNVNPVKSYEVELTFISDESELDENQIISFMAEANWMEKPEDEKLGLKGSAFLYGDRVSLFYFIVRKPLRYIRNFFGV